MSESDTPAGGSRYGATKPAQPPAPIKTLDSLCAASTIAHETIYELHRRLALQDADTQEHGQLLAESAQITTKEIPDTVAGAQRLASRWNDQAIIDPEGAQETLLKLASAVETCEPTLRALLDRQQMIATSLRSRLGMGALD